MAMANWTPDGFIGTMFRIGSTHLPPPPGLPAPTLWGDLEVVRRRFGPKVRIEAVKRERIAEYPMSPAQVVDFFRQYFGPLKMAFAQLDAAGAKALREDLVSHWTLHNEGDATRTVVRGEYLEVHARRDRDESLVTKDA